MIAELVSTDDGYASAKARKEVLGMEVKSLSISGAKAKKRSAKKSWIQAVAAVSEEHAIAMAATIQADTRLPEKHGTIGVDLDGDGDQSDEWRADQQSH